MFEHFEQSNWIENPPKVAITPQTNPNAPCREYLPTFPLECSHFSPNEGKYSIHGASGKNRVKKNSQRLSANSFEFWNHQGPHHHISPLLGWYGSRHPGWSGDEVSLEWHMRFSHLSVILKPVGSCLSIDFKYPPQAGWKCPPGIGDENRKAMKLPIAVSGQCIINP